MNLLFVFIVYFEDKDADGLLTTELATTNPDHLEVLQRLWYYPFGMEMEAVGQALTTPYQGARYNGKELEQMTGVYAYGFRHYDSTIGRFTGADPIAEQFAGLSVYNYASNDPVQNVDLHGLQGIPATGAVTPSAAGILYEAYQNARAGLFNMEMRAIEAFSSQNTVTRMRVNYDEYGGIPTGSPVRVVTEQKKGTVAELGDAALDLLAFTPFAELHAIKGASRIRGPFLAAKSSSVSGFTSLYRAVSPAELEDIVKHGVRVSPDGGGYQMGKLFATTSEDAAEYGRLLQAADESLGKGKTSFHVIEVKVPNSVLENSYLFDADGMKAVSIPSELLGKIKY